MICKINRTLSVVCAKIGKIYFSGNPGRGILIFCDEIGTKKATPTGLSGRRSVLRGLDNF